VPVVSRFFGIVIGIFFDDVGRHKRPHIHVIAAEFAASIAINNGAILAGNLPVPIWRLVRKFVRVRRAELQHAWDETVAGRTPPKVAPLKTR
jgi:hypothetical protein